MSFETYLKFHFSTTTYTPSIAEVRAEIDRLLDDLNDSMILWTLFGDDEYFEDIKATRWALLRENYKLQAIQLGNTHS